jgi:hypothetical protein
LKNLISLFRRSQSSATQPARAVRRSTSLSVERLEQRDVPATLPINLTGGGGAVWSGFNSDDVDGFHLTDAQFGTLVNAFDNFWTLSVNGNVFNPGTDATLTTNSLVRNLLSNSQTIDGLSVSQQFTVFRDSPIMRVLVRLQNTTSNTVDATIALNGNLGADTATVVSSTSSGDSTFSTSDRWVIFSGGANIPVSSIVIGGPGQTAEQPTTVAGANGDDVFATSYEVSLRAGQTRYLLFYTRLDSSSTDARSAMGTFDNVRKLTTARMLFGMTNLQRRQVLNWNFQPKFVAVAADAGGQPIVKIFNESGQFLYSFLAYEPTFRGGVHVAMADINGDTIPEIIVAPGAGRAPEVRIYNVFTGQLVRSFLAYNSEFRGGVFVAAGDVNGDGVADIVTGMGAGANGRPFVRAFNGLNRQMLFQVRAYAAGFTGGVRVAVADFNDDGVADILTAPGAGLGSKIRGLDSTMLADNNYTVADDTDPDTDEHNELNDELFNFNAYDDTFHGGVFIATGDTNGDGTADIITGNGEGLEATVKVFNGLNRTQLRSTTVYDPTFQGGVRVATADVNGDGRADIITGVGPGILSSVNYLNGADGKLLRFLSAFPAAFVGGEFVAGY